MSSGLLNKWLTPSRLLFVAFMSVFCLSYMGPIIEGDFFHHLRAGQEILSSAKVPRAFPTQWLGQVLLYLVWSIAGFKGITLLRVAVYASVLGFLFMWMRRQEVPFYASLFFLLIPAHMFLSFPSERPQMFSFLLFAPTVYLLELRRLNNKSRAYFLVLPLVLLWANIHPGFIIGAAVVWIYFIGAGVSCLRGNAPWRTLPGIGAIALSPGLVLVFFPKAMAFIPDTINSILKPNPYTQSMHEYLSPLDAALRLGEYYPSYWLFVLVAGFVLIRAFKRLAFEHVLLILLFAALPFQGLRFMPFATMLVPIAASGLKFEGQHWEQSKTLLLGFTAILAAWLIFTPMDPRLGPSPEFPDKAVKFVKRTELKGKVFNYYGWAGYFSWSLPKLELFMPPVGIQLANDEAYGQIIWAQGGQMLGKPLWSALLDAYGLDMIIMPGMSPISGEVFPLIDAIQTDRGWQLIYSDSTSNIFVRENPNNLRAISTHSTPKLAAYRQIELQALRLLDKHPDKESFKQALAFARARLSTP